MASSDLDVEPNSHNHSYGFNVKATHSNAVGIPDVSVEAQNPLRNFRRSSIVRHFLLKLEQVRKMAWALLHTSAFEAITKSVIRRRKTMLWTILVILLILWLIGAIGGFAGNLIHLLLVVALVVFIINLVSGRRAV